MTQPCQGGAGCPCITCANREIAALERESARAREREEEWARMAAGLGARIAELERELAATTRALHRFQHGAEIEGDLVCDATIERDEYRTRWETLDAERDRWVDVSLQWREAARKAEAERDEGRLALARIGALVGALRCPACGKLHTDDGRTPEEQAWAARPHRTHLCVDDAAGKGCGATWVQPVSDVVAGVENAVVRPVREGRCPVTLALPGIAPTADAILSDCGRYRYLLTRGAPSVDRVLWVMLNPSVADAEQDDPTIRRCRGFAREWGHQAIAVCNLFAWRATDPRALTAAVADGFDIVGPENDRYIEAAARSPRTKRIVVGWGISHRRARDRGIEVRELLKRVRPDLSVACLGVTDDGSPRHPLYVAGETTPRPWGIAEAAAPRRVR